MTVPLPGNSSQVYGAAPPFENTLNTTASADASSSYMGGQPPSLSQQVYSLPLGPKETSLLPYPPTLQANAHGAGKTRVLEAGARFNSHQQVEMAAGFPPPLPDPYTTPNPQGAYNYLWQLSHIWIEHEGSDDLRLVIQLKKVRSGWTFPRCGGGLLDITYYCIPFPRRKRRSFVDNPSMNECTWAFTIITDGTFLYRCIQSAVWAECQ